MSLPVFQGHVGQRLMIVGQAPGPSSGQRGVPYTGATGKTLQRWLERAGFPPGALHRDFYLTSLTKCFPGPATGPRWKRGSSAVRQGDRALRAASRPGDRAGAARDRRRRWGGWPRSASIRRRGEWPLSELVGSLRPAERAGHVFRLLPLPHPSGVSRWLNDPAHVARLDAALAVLKRERQDGRRRDESEVGGRRSEG